MEDTTVNSKKRKVDENTTADSKKRREEDTNRECKNEKESGMETTGEDDATGEKYKKPYHYYIFCQKLFSKLRNHMENKHKDSERVKQALKLPNLQSL